MLLNFNNNQTGDNSRPNKLSNIKKEAFVINYTQSQLSIGLDISKESISIFVPKNSLDLEINNTPKDIKSFYSKLKKIYKKEIENIVFVYEPTGSYSELLRKFCADKKINSFIINPKRSHNFAKAYGNRNKTDKIDAKLLSEAIVLAKDGEITIPVINPLVETIKEMMSYYKFTIKQRVMANNHLESISSKDGDKYVIKSLQKEIKILKDKEGEIIDNIKAIIDNDENLSQGYENIKTIMGVGKIGAIVLLHLFIKYPNANKRQLTSLVGLDPIVFKSGSSVDKRIKISKAGSTLYRGSLFMGVMVAVRHNDEMRNFYERLKANGKHTSTAQIAVMRKMIIIAHSLYKNNQQYSSDVYKKACGMS